MCRHGKVDRVELSAKLEELHVLYTRWKDETTTSIAEAKAMAHSNARVGSQSTAPAPLKLVHQADDMDAQFLPSIVAGGDNRPLGGGRGLTSSNSDRTASRQAATSRAAHGAKSKTPIRPLTESRTQSQNVNPFSPRPPPPPPTAADGITTSSAGGPGPAIPMTPNQEAYAKIVSEDQLRQMLEGLPVMPYNS